MRIGFTLPQVGALAHEAPEIARYAREAERLGADSLWVFDRLLAPVRPAIGYNGADPWPPEFDSLLDPLGRDPDDLRMILRVYPRSSASLDDITTAIARAADEAGVDHAFVDLMYLAKSVDHALELAGRVLGLVRTG